MKRLLVLFALAAGCTGKYVRPTTTRVVSATPEMLARGNYLVNQVSMCTACHTPRVGGTWLGGERTDAFLAGGSVINDADEGFRIAIPNISQDKETGIGAWTDDEILRATRDGVAKDGRLMWPPMPFGSYHFMSDDDAHAVVAYLRTAPAVKNKVDRDHNKFPLMMKVAHGMGAMHKPPAKDVKAPPVSDKKAHGRYLATLGVCVECHSLTSTGPDPKDHLLAGSKVPFSEPEYGKVWARNLTPDMDTGLGKFTAEQIKEALKTGRRLDGKPMAPPMSVLIPHLSTWSDEDLDALVTFMKSIPAIKFKVPERQLTAEAKRLVGE